MTSLEAEPAGTVIEERAAELPAALAAAKPAHILRFYKSERLLHWALAIPFLVCLGSALVLVFLYNPDPQRPYRALFSWSHRISGMALTVLPLVAVLRCRGDICAHFYNIRQAWIWVVDDFKWLVLLGVSAITKRVRMPDQGKFNAAEKINFMVLMATYPLYIATGVLMWLTHVAFVSWVLHVCMALFALPLILGHLYMALISRSGRPGLTGMITGFVPRDWARHHYGHWYREWHEPNGRPATPQPAEAPGSSEN